MTTLYIWSSWWYSISILLYTFFDLLLMLSYLCYISHWNFPESRLENICRQIFSTYKWVVFSKSYDIYLLITYSMPDSVLNIGNKHSLLNWKLIFFSIQITFFHRSSSLKGGYVPTLFLQMNFTQHMVLLHSPFILSSRSYIAKIPPSRHELHSLQ